MTEEAPSLQDGLDDLQGVFENLFNPKGHVPFKVQLAEERTRRVMAETVSADNETKLAKLEKQYDQLTRMYQAKTKSLEHDILVLESENAELERTQSWWAKLKRWRKNR